MGGLFGGRDGGGGAAMPTNSYEPVGTSITDSRVSVYKDQQGKLFTYSGTGDPNEVYQYFWANNLFQPYYGHVMPNAAAASAAPIATPAPAAAPAPGPVGTLGLAPAPTPQPATLIGSLGGVGAAPAAAAPAAAAPAAAPTTLSGESPGSQAATDAQTGTKRRRRSASRGRVSTLLGDGDNAPEYLGG